MKDFLKFTLATVAGIVLVCVAAFLLGIISLFGIISASEKEIPVEKNSIFTLTLNKPIKERATENPLALIMGNEYESIGLNDILSSIKKAKEEENIIGIYLEAGQFGGSSPASLEEIRRALLDFKNSGKFIVAYGDNYSQGEYYLCSIADKIILNPQGSIDWTGLSAQPIFYKRLLEKLGVEMQIFKVGTYKSAVEPFIATEMSEANREQVTAYLSSIWNQMVEDVAASRGLSTSILNEYANNMLSMDAATEFVQTGMADTLLYKDEAKAYLKALTNTEEDESINTLGLNEMKNIKRNVPLDKSGNIIAVYYATGEITDYPSQSPTMGDLDGIIGSNVIKDLDRLRNDDNVKAVVLRVNSPGGSAFASEQIWNEIVKLKAEKPVIVSMSDYAASGGYYISCAADSIFAEATTLTGSIGIFGMLPNLEGLLTNKLGLDFDIVKTNKFSDIGSPTRAMTESEKSLLQRTINRGYDTFVKRCADGRQMSEDAIRKIAEGRVWTGAMAKELGLVDKLGGINEAIAAAASKAAIKAYTILVYPEQPNLFTSLMEQERGNYINSYLQDMTNGYYNYQNIVQRLLQANRVQAHMGMIPSIQL